MVVRKPIKPRIHTRILATLKKPFKSLGHSKTEQLKYKKQLEKTRQQLEKAKRAA